MKKIVLLSLLLLVSGCSSIHTFQEPSKDSDFAEISFGSMDDWTKYLGNQLVYPVQINGKNPSFWKWSHKKFRLPPGKNSLIVKTYLPGNRIEADAYLEFVAKAGEKYEAVRTPSEKSIVFQVVDSSSVVVSSTESNKNIVNRSTNYVPVYVPAK